jgi:hypothetical protein
MRYERSSGIVLAAESLTIRKQDMATREDLARTIGAQLSLINASRELVGTRQDEVTVDAALPDNALTRFTYCVMNVVCSAWSLLVRASPRSKAAGESDEVNLTNGPHFGDHA